MQQSASDQPQNAEIDPADPMWEQLLTITGASGLTVNGDNPYDPQVHNADLASRIFSQGMIALGESYMDRWWDCEELDDMMTRGMVDGNHKNLWNKRKMVTQILKARLYNFQKKSLAFEVGEKHYDIGNDLFEKMLDPTMCLSLIHI